MSIRTRAAAAINATVNAGIKAFWSDYGFSGSNASGGGVYGSGSHRVPDQVRRYRNTDAAESSLIAAAVEFKGREMRNIRFVAQRLRRGEWEAVDHPVNDILRMPNPLYGSSGLNLATSWDMTLFGDGYWRTERNARGVPMSLHWMPQPQVRLQPREWRPGIETTYIYQPSHGAGRMTLAEADVIHFRHGISAGDPRRGVSPIASLLEEVGVDEEAARYAITALWNRGVVGLLATLGPDDDGQYPPTEDLEDIRDYLDQRFSGPGRGRTGVLQGRVALQQVGANPGDMAMDVLRQVPEQRVAAVLGIPAAVLGFGSGLDATKVGATMAQMERQAIRNGVLPDAEEIAETLTMQLNIAGVRIGLDTSAVLALQPDQEMLTRVWNLRVAGGVASRAEARTAWNLPVTQADEVYLMPFGLVEQPVGQPMAQPAMRTRQLSANTGQLKQGDDEIADLIRRLSLTLDSQGSAFSRTLRSMLLDLGDVLGDVFGEHRDDGADAIANAIVARAQAWQVAELEASYVTMWRSMLVATVGDVNAAMGLAINIPDSVATGVLARGGRRAGLVDITESTRRNVLRIMEDAGVNQTSMRDIQRQIAEQVPAGRFSTSDVRAATIARTEVKFSQNVSSITAYEASEDIESVRVIDAQIGPTDAECEALDGTVVSFGEAMALAASEHPNGTRSFAPIVRPPQE